MNSSQLNRAGSRIFLVVLACLAGASSFAQIKGWKDLKVTSKLAEKSTILGRVSDAKTYSLDLATLRQSLANAPEERAVGLFSSPAVITLPISDGTWQRFAVAESSILSPELQAKLPYIKTYLVQGLDDRTRNGRISVTALGFHAMVFSPNGTEYIDPIAVGNTRDYVVYNRENLSRIPGWTCYVTEFDENFINSEREGSGDLFPMATGANLKTYRLAMNATGEYCNYFGSNTGTGSAAAVSAMGVTINRVTGIYERDFSIRLNAVYLGPASEPAVLDPATDGFTNSNVSTLLGQNQTRCDTNVGNASYDVGHIMGTGGGGVAGLGVVGVTGQKARGATTGSPPTTDAFDIDYVAHELGHQFNGDHTFAGTTGSCAGNGNPSTAFEPGSGSTIMAYAGICTGQNVQSNSDDYFHHVSYQEVLTLRALATGTSTANGNSAPVVTVPATSYTIPLSTPFVLSASATDANGDALTYCWEQYATTPLFRSIKPVTVGYRVFPKLTTILGTAVANYETLATTTRTIPFRVSVRDNRAGGGELEWKSVSVTMSGTAFTVDTANSATAWVPGATVPVAWTVGGSGATANVNITMSTNGGTSFFTGAETTLLASTANSGSASITVPWVNTTTGRIKIQGVNNIFFDINNASITINESAAVNMTVPATIKSGATGTGTILLANPAPAGGLTVNLTEASSYMSVPSTVVVPAGATSADFAITTVAAPSNQNVQIGYNRSGWSKASSTFVIQKNTAPGGVADSYNTPYATTLNIGAPGVLGNDTDAELDTLTAALLTTTANGSLTLNANGSFTYTPNAGFSGVDSFTYRASDSALFSPSTTVQITVGPRPQLLGTVTLSGWTAPVTGQPVEVQIRTVGSPTPLYTFNVALSASGQFVINLVPPTLSGNYDVAIKGQKWLRGTVASVNFSTTVATANISLINGDVNNDNQIDFFDYLIMSDTFEKSLGDSGYDARADLNGDNTVDFFDYLILSAGYDLEGN